MPQQRRFDHCEDWEDIRSNWDIRPDTNYLNHGSFGISPRPVLEARRRWLDECDRQPMDVYLRLVEPELRRTRERLGRFLGTAGTNLALVENATYAMNVVAESFPLRLGDEVLLSDHEYGAVVRIWQRRTERVGAKLVIAKMPERFESVDQVRDALLAGLTNRTRLAVFSHITSPTALIWPVAEMTKAIRSRGVAVCIDGPHAPAQVPLDLDALDCDFYLASCHKWLCAPLGTGFIYVHPRQQEIMQPLVKSWGLLPPAFPASWDEEFLWQGTRDYSGFLAIPAAIDFLEQIGLDNFRHRTYWLAQLAEQELCKRTGEQPLGDRSGGWYGTMTHVPLPAGDWSNLQRDLWEKFRIEAPVNHFQDRWFIRVSCHLHTTRINLNHLFQAMDHILSNRT
jgi:isopenicillin-N epimerase